MRASRRRLLVLAGGGVIASSALIGWAGLRYPPPQFTPDAAPRESGESESGRFTARAEGAIYQSRDGERFRFRAFTPEPVLAVAGGSDGEWQLEVRNLHPEAVMESDAPGLTETRQNLVRTVRGTAARADIRWRFPRVERYRFAAIGDTGGGRELRWVLARAEALGADFVLHLGDFNYGKGEYLGSVTAFDEAGIPTYVAIGNHDFYEGFSSVHPLFRQHIGPRNSSFELGGIQFLNIDTAAGFIPAGSGVRGAFLKSLTRPETARDVVVFTHKPLRDPRDDEAHSIPRMEYRFLHEHLKRLGADTILVGHIHIKEDFDDDGIRTLVSGQGLAHADLIVDRPYAEILLGDVSPESDKVAYQWAPLEMPFEMHCNPRAWEVLVAIEKPGVLRQLKELCREP